MNHIILQANRYRSIVIQKSKLYICEVHKEIAFIQKSIQPETEDKRLFDELYIVQALITKNKKFSDNQNRRIITQNLHKAVILSTTK